MTKIKLAVFLGAIGIITGSIGLWYNEPYLAGLGGGICVVMLFEFYLECFIDKDRGDNYARE